MPVFRTGKTLSDLNSELIQFDRNWKRSFSNGTAIYVATKDNAALTINSVVKRKLIPVVIHRFKKGRKIVVIGTAVHTPPHTTQVL